MADDFRFDDDDDIFGDDDFSFDDDDGGDDDDFSYGDEDFDDGSFDTDIFDDEPDNDLEFIDGDSGGGGGGPSRGFLLIAGLFIIILLAGVILLVVALMGGQENPVDITRTHIANLNATTERQIAETATQSAINTGLTQTATLFTPTPSNTPTPTATATEDAAGTQAALDLTATAEALMNATDVAGTALALTLTSQPTVEGPTIAPTTDPDAISPVQAAQMTATALADLFNQTPTVDVTAGAGTTTTTTTTTGTSIDEMPDTGLFDDIGTENAGIFFLMAFGLIGVIVGSRRVRTINKRKRREF